MARHLGNVLVAGRDQTDNGNGSDSMALDLMIGGSAVAAAFLHHTLKDLVCHDLGGGAASLSQSLARLVVDKVRLAQGRLPPNHDLRDASLESFRAAAFILGHAVGRELEPKLPLASALLDHIKKRTLFEQPLIEIRHTTQKPQADWLNRLLRACKEGHGFKQFHDKIVLDDREMDSLLLRNVDQAVQSSIHAAFRKWADETLGTESQPPCFKEYLDNGFPLEDGDSAHVTFFQTYCLEFKQHVKHNRAVEAILTTETLAAVKDGVRTMAAGQKAILTRLDRLDQPKQRVTSELFDQWLDGRLSRIELSLSYLARASAEHARASAEHAQASAEHAQASAEAHREIHEGVQSIRTIVEDERDRALRRAGASAKLIEWNDFSLPANLVERLGPLRELHDALWTEATTKLVGRVQIRAPGGHGKTVLVSHYAHLHRERYEGGVFKIDCEGRSLATALIPLLHQESREALKNLTEYDRALIVKGKLSGGKRCLLVLDNIDSEIQWREFRESNLLPTSPCHLILTTRSDEICDVTAIELGNLTEEEAIRLLAKFRPSAAGKMHRDSVLSILRETEGIAALLAAVGMAMSEDQDDDWNGYAGWLINAKPDDLPGQTSLNKDWSDYRLNAVAILDDLRRRLKPPAVRVLDYAAILPQDLIPLKWLEGLLEADANPERGVNTVDLGTTTRGQKKTPASVLKVLRERDLLRPSSQDGTLWGVHRLHRKRAADHLEADQTKKSNLLKAVETVCVADANGMLDAAWHPEKHYLLIPLQKVGINLVRNGLWPAPWLIYKHTVFAIGTLQWYEARIEFIDEMLDAAKSLRVRPTADELAELHNGKGFTLFAMDKPKAAVPELQYALRVAATAVSPRMPSLANIRSVLARTFAAIGRFEEVDRLKTPEPDLAAANTWWQKIGAAEFYTNFAAAMSAGAKAEQRLAPLREAREWGEQGLRRSEEARRETLGNDGMDDPDHANYLVNFADILEQLGDLREAKNQFDSALRVWRAGVGDANPLTLGVSIPLAFLEIQRGDLARAEELLNKAGKIVQDNTKINVTEWTSIIECWAELRAARGDVDQAADKLLEAIQSLRTLSGTIADAAVRWQIRRAWWLVESHPNAAIDAFRDAMDTATRQYGDRPRLHAEVFCDAVDFVKFIADRMSVDVVGRASTVVGNPEDLLRRAEELFEESGMAKDRPPLPLRRARANVCHDTPATSSSSADGADEQAYTFCAEAEEFWNQRDYTRALSSYRSAHEVLSVALGGDYPTLASYHAAIAQTQTEVDDREGALKTWQRILDLRRCHYHPNSPVIIDTLNATAGVLLDIGRIHEAYERVTEGEQLARAFYGAGHWAISNQILNVALYQTLLGQHADSEQGIAEAEQLLVHAGKLDSGWRAEISLRRADNALEEGRLEQAWSFYCEHDRHTASVVEKDEAVLSNRDAMRAKFVSASGEHEQAVRLMRAAVDELEAKKDTLRVARAVRKTNFARILRKAAHLNNGYMAEAYEQASGAIGEMENLLGPDHPVLADKYFERGEINLALEKRSEALDDFRRAHKLRVVGYGPDSPKTHIVAARVSELQKLEVPS